MHQSSRDKIRSFRDRYLDHRIDEPLVILDLGSLDVNGSYREYFALSSWIYLGLDLVSGSNVDIVLQNPYTWKEVRSNYADVIISGQTFEHIEFFWITMLSIARVLKPEGLSCIIAPAGGFEHRYPVDCWRFYPDGLAALARFARLDVIEVSTQWEPDPRYTDGSNRWQDSMLVCRKPRRKRLNAFREAMRRGLLHMLLTRSLSGRT